MSMSNYSGQRPVLTRNQILRLYRDERPSFLLLFEFHNALLSGRAGLSRDERDGYISALSYLKLFLKRHYDNDELRMDRFHPHLIFEYEAFLGDSLHLYPAEVRRIMDCVHRVLRIAFAYGLLIQPINEN